MKAIDTDLDWVHEHTRLLVRAREWEARKYDTSLLRRRRRPAGEAGAVTLCGVLEREVVSFAVLSETFPFRRFCRNSGRISSGQEDYGQHDGDLARHVRHTIGHGRGGIVGGAAHDPCSPWRLHGPF